MKENTKHAKQLLTQIAEVRDVMTETGRSISAHKAQIDILREKINIQKEYYELQKGMLKNLRTELDKTTQE